MRRREGGREGGRRTGRGGVKPPISSSVLQSPERGRRVLTAHIVVRQPQSLTLLVPAVRGLSGDQT